ncbi:MAG: LAGLIDADG family homing endonuclease [Actinomycetota bacterium]
MNQIRAYLAGSSRDATWNTWHRTTRWSQADRRWLEIINTLLGRLGSKAWIYREGTRHVWVSESTYCAFDDPPLASRADLAAWARGYFDAEGGVPRDAAARFYIQFVQKNHPDLTQLRSVLGCLGIRCGVVHTPSVRVQPGYFRFYVSAASHLDFIRKIGSWHPRKRPLLDERRALSELAAVDVPTSRCG